MLRENFFLLLIAGLLTFSTNDKRPPLNALEKLINNFYSFSKQFPQQKIYVHTDKPYYITGDDLFGKIYLINEGWGTYDSIRNKKIYVELINEENTVVKKIIVNGLYSSLGFSFHLNDSIGEGNYVLRAYTSWMAGFNNGQNIFSSYIHISDKVIIKQNQTKVPLKIKTVGFEKLPGVPSLNNDIDVQFLPEGGNLVNDIENNVAFKAIDGYGHGMDVQGYVKDSKGVVVCSFRSQHLGMGKFAFIPESGSSYIAYVKPIGGKEVSYPFNPTGNYAYQLSVVKKSKEEVQIRVALGDSLYKKNITTYLVAASHGSVCFTSRGIDLYEETIPLGNFPEGIAQLTLFDSALQPVSERLLYVHHPAINVTIRANKENYRQREKVTLQLKTTDMAGRSLRGMYSVSVTDDHVVKHDEDEGNIKTHLLLSPYLKGYIEQPGYYLKSDDMATQEDLDLVMLTHGWSRFTWSDIETNATINTTKKDSSLFIRGKLTNNKNVPVSRYAVSLFSASDNIYIGTDITNEEGEFNFTGLDFTDSTSFIIQTKSPKGLNEDVNISVDATPFPLTNVDRSFVPGEHDADLLDGINYYLRNMYDSPQSKEKVVVLKEINLSSTKRKVNYDESRRVSQVSYIIPPDFIEKYGNFNLLDVLYSVPGVTIFDGHISFFGRNSMTSYSDPLLILDGVESTAALSINPHDIDFIEVLRGGEAAIYGVRGANGVVLVNTKKGKDALVNFTQKGIKSLYLTGYHIQKNFYSPKYETDAGRQAKPKDERTTIYWNENVTIDPGTPATISFYTADMPATYTVTLEGIAQNGEFIHKVFPIKRTRQ